MQTISATHSAFVKRVLPFVVVVGASAWSYWSKRNLPNALVLAISSGVLFTIIMLVILRRGFWRMADIVEDYGDRLVITRWRTKVEIPISHVREVRREPQLRGSEVTLILNEPSALGSEVTFLAPDRRTSPGIEERLDALSRRAGSQERNRVA
jgi:hypothetical protein